MREKQAAQKLYYDVQALPRTLGVGNAVYALNFHNGLDRLTGHIIAQAGVLSWVIEIPDGRHIHRRHNQICLQYHVALPVENSHSDVEVTGVTKSIDYLIATCRDREIAETTEDLKVTSAEMIVLSESSSAPATHQGAPVFPLHHSRRSPQPRNGLDL